jgi:hypothetical protein
LDSKPTKIVLVDAVINDCDEIDVTTTGAVGAERH